MCLVGTASNGSSPASDQRISDTVLVSAAAGAGLNSSSPQPALSQPSAAGAEVVAVGAAAADGARVGVVSSSAPQSSSSSHPSAEPPPSVGEGSSPPLDCRGDTTAVREVTRSAEVNSGHRSTEVTCKAEDTAARHSTAANISNGYASGPRS